MSCSNCGGEPETTHTIVCQVFIGGEYHTIEVEVEACCREKAMDSIEEEFEMRYGDVK